MYDRSIPTAAQREYVHDLMAKLGYDEDNYDLDNMTRSEMARLIDELRHEYDGGGGR